MSAGLPAAVLWDFDGTLMDTEPVWGELQGAFIRELGAELPDDFQHHTVGRPMADSVRYMASVTGLALDVEGVAAELWARATIAVREGPLRWSPGARELVLALAEAGVPQALVSTSLRSYLDAALARLPEAPFAFVVGGDEVARRKPDPEPYLTAARALGAPPDASLVIEDSRSGVASGLAAGCAVLAVPTVDAFTPEGRLSVRTTLAGLTIDDLPALLAGR